MRMMFSHKEILGLGKKILASLNLHISTVWAIRKTIIILAVRPSNLFNLATQIIIEEN